MNSYESIIDDIRIVLTADTDPLEDTLRELDQRFADAVREVNERLKRCDTLLNQGHRSEAIELCELEPKLLEVVAVLDFPERALWAQYVKQFGFPGPPVLLVEVAEQLNEAYTEDAALSELLRRHRLQALLRSPLAVRIKTMRTIARRDSGNPIWPDDIQTFERVRHTQIQSELEHARSKKDVATLAALEQEVRSGEWLLPPARELSQRVFDAHTKARVYRARQQLDKLVNELTEAYGNFDLPLGRTLRASWHAQAAIGIESDDDPLLELVAPALNWLDEKDREEQEEADFQRTRSELEQALEDWAPRKEIERLAFRLQNFDREYPELLKRRIQERFQQFELQARRKTRLVVVAATLFIAVCGALVVWTGRSIQQARARDASVAVLAELIGNNKLAQADKYIAEVSRDRPRIAEQAQFQKLIKDLEVAKNKEADRRSRFEELLQSGTELGMTWNGFGAGMSALARSEKLAANDGERARIVQERRKIEKNRLDLQKQFDQEFIRDLTAYRDECDGVDPTDLEQLQTLIKSGETLQLQNQVSRQLLLRVEPLVLRLKSQMKTELDTRNRDDLVERISSTVGQSESFVRALQAYMAKEPNTARSIQFDEVIKIEMPLWEGVREWSNLVVDWSGIDHRDLPIVNAKRQIDQFTELSSKHAGYVGTAEFATLMDHLKYIQARGSGEDSQVRKLQQPLNAGVVKDLHVVLVSRNGRLARYYFPVGGDLPERQKNAAFDRWIIKHCVDFDLQNVQRLPLEYEQVTNPMKPGTNLVDWTSPQVRFRNAALDLIAGLSDNNWDETYCSMLVALFKEPTLDPLMQFMLAEKVLQIGCSGSLQMHDHFKDTLEAFGNKAFDETANWIDPDDMDAERARVEAGKLLNILATSLAEVVADDFNGVRTWDQHLNKPDLGNGYRWVGWLIRNSSGDWECRLRSSRLLADDNSELFVFPGPQQVVKIGGLQDGEPQLDMSKPMKEGRPVFINVNPAATR